MREATPRAATPRDLLYVYALASIAARRAAKNGKRYIVAVKHKGEPFGFRLIATNEPALCHASVAVDHQLATAANMLYALAHSAPVRVEFDEDDVDEYLT